MNNRPYAFISYSRKDKAFVERLAHDLQMAGIDTWVDVERIKPGSNWQKEIVLGLDQASILLYVSSKHSIDSTWMEREVSEYFRELERIIPIIIDEEGARNIPPYLASIQWADFRQDYNKAFDSLKDGVISITGSGPSIESRLKKSKGYVFLSYAEEDSEFLFELRTFLEDNGYAYWDFEKSDRDYQTQISLELEGIIREATATLSILSPAWKGSMWAVKEYFFCICIANHF